MAFNSWHNTFQRIDILQTLYRGRARNSELKAVCSLPSTTLECYHFQDNQSPSDEYPNPIQLTSTATVIVRLEDGDDQNPMFLSNSYMASVVENEAVVSTNENKHLDKFIRAAFHQNRHITRRSGLVEDLHQE